MNRRRRPDGQWEVLVNTPIGFVWQLESLPTPGVGGKTSEHYSAAYNPMGRQADVPASAYTGRREYENMFDDIFGGLAGGGKSLPLGAASAVKKGGSRIPHDNSAMFPELSPYPDKYLKRGRY